MQGLSHVLLLAADGWPVHVQQRGCAASPHGRRSARWAQGGPPHSQGALGALRQSQFFDHSRSACRMATGASWTDARWPTARTLRFARSWWCRARPRTRRLLAAPILARPWRPSSTPCQVHNSSILPSMHLVAKGGIFTNLKV